MPQESLAQVSKRRAYGVLFLVIIIGFVWLSIAIYQKKFTSFTYVTLYANHTGNQLILDSDVKVTGLIVGSVKEVGVGHDPDDIQHPGSQSAMIKLALDPDKAKLIPSNVSAQILPKTLFGEQYVSLVRPSDPKGTLAHGGTIHQDVTKGAIEAQDVFGDLLPLLTAVQPAKLNATLTAVATALNGRGKELGTTLTNLDAYLKQLNPHSQQLVDDLDKLGQVALEYNNVAPDIFATLNNLQTSVKTVVDRQASLDKLLTVGNGTAGVLDSFLSDNKQRLIDITGQTQKIYALLAEYSPEYSCLLKGINKLADLAGDAIYDNRIHLSATLDTTNIGPYKQGEEPKLLTGYGPSCFGLPNAQVPFQIPAKYQCLNDGAALTANPCGASAASSSSAKQEDLTSNSRQESALVNTLIASKLGTTPNKVPQSTTMLIAPLYRGGQVTVK